MLGTPLLDYDLSDITWQEGGNTSNLKRGTSIRIGWSHVMESSENMLGSAANELFNGRQSNRYCLLLHNAERKPF